MTAVVAPRLFIATFAIAVHVVGLLVSVAGAVSSTFAQLPHLHYFAAMLCAVWVALAAVLSIRFRRAEDLFENNVIPAAAMFPCSLGILLLGRPSIGFSYLSFASALLFVTLPYSSLIASIVNGLWTAVFVAYYFGVGHSSLGMSAAVLSVVIVGSNLVTKELWRESQERARLLDQARWAATTLPAVTMSLHKKVQEARQQAVRDERARLAQLLHDSTGYSLTATVVQLNALRELASQTEICSRIEMLEDLVRQTSKEVKDQVSDLRSNPESTGTVHWPARWRQLCTVFQDCTGVSIRSDIDIPTKCLVDGVGETVYRTIQEGLTNAYRHGHATYIHVMAQYLDDRKLLLLKISDNGKGAAKTIPGNGLRGILVRVQSLNGTATWATHPGKGFDIGIDIPLQDQPEVQ